MNSTTLPDNGQVIPSKGLYVHIPFCMSLCPFCDFMKLVERRYEQHIFFLERLFLQCQSLANHFDLSSVKTAYIGGGTPTFLGRKLLKLLLTQLYRYCPNLQEVSIETNPELLDRDLLFSLKDSGVNRWSLGIQSTSDQLLKILGRRNRHKHNIQAAELLAKHIPQHFSFDFMYGLAAQKMSDIERDIAFIRRYSVAHVSWYQLTIEENTPYARYLQEGRISLPSGETCSTMAEQIVLNLHEQGLKRYEISSYSHNHYRCRHNQHYWKMDSTLGVGPAAVGTLIAKDPAIGSWRQQGSRKFESYLQEENFSTIWQHITARESAFEFIMMNLRLKEGFSLDIFKKRFTMYPSQIFPESWERSQRLNWLSVFNGCCSATAEGYKFLDTMNLWFWQEASK